MSSWVGDGCADDIAALLVSCDQHARVILRLGSTTGILQDSFLARTPLFGRPWRAAAGSGHHSDAGATTLPGTHYARSAGGPWRRECFGLTEYFD
jgi:hypothetical protein